VHVETFDKEKHLPTMQEWLAERGTGELRADLLPTFGLVVSGESGPLALGFIYQTDSTACFIENYVANPKETTEARSGALDELTIQLANAARNMGYKYLWSHTACPAIVARAKRHGFVADEANTYRSIFLCL